MRGRPIRLLSIWLALSLSLCLAFAALWWHWRSLPYNDQGRYFDVETATIITHDGVLVYGGASIACALVAAILTIWILRRRSV